MEMTDLIQPCPACAEVRKAYDQAWQTLCETARGRLRLKEEKVAGDGTRVDCRRCGNRGEVLTAAGEKLVQFVKGWADQAKEIPF